MYPTNQVGQVDKVNLFVVGAAKAGTTSIYNYMQQHPDIFMSPIKEPHFFSTDVRKENFTQENYNHDSFDTKKYFSSRPLKRMHIAFIDKESEYRSLFEGSGPASILGETSTGYLYSSTAAANIAHFNPDAKILIILREPVERAYSHWKMNLAAGTADPEKSFLATVLDDYSATPKGWGISNLYIDLGLYYEQVKRYMDNFPNQNVKITTYDLLQQNPKKFMADIFEFLGVTDYPVDTSEMDNISVLPRFPFIKKINNKIHLSSLLPKALKIKLKKLISKKTFPVYSADDKRQLYAQFFSAEIEKMKNILGIDLISWQ